MSSTRRALCRISGSGPSRLSFAQSTATSTRSPASGGSCRRSSSSSMNAYSFGSGAPPARYITASLPSWRSASVVASSEPSASPSGFSCVVTRKRFCSLSAAATAARSFVVVVWGELIDQPGHLDAPYDRRIVLKGELRGPLQPQLPADARLEDAVRGLQPRDRLLALALGAEDAHEDARRAEVAGGLDACDRHEPDARVVQVADAVGEHLPQGFVHTTHALAHGSNLATRAASQSA